MQGPLVWRYLPAHIFYEGLAFIGMTAQGQASVWLKAKLAAWRMRRWVSDRRQKTRLLIEKEGPLSARLDHVSSLMIPTRRLLSNRMRS
jgi:hypothetical protein